MIRLHSYEISGLAPLLIVNKEKSQTNDWRRMANKLQNNANISKKNYITWVSSLLIHDIRISQLPRLVHSYMLQYINFYVNIPVVCDIGRLNGGGKGEGVTKRGKNYKNYSKGWIVPVLYRDLKILSGTVPRNVLVLAEHKVRVLPCKHKIAPIFYLIC